MVRRSGRAVIEIEWIMDHSHESLHVLTLMPDDDTEDDYSQTGTGFHSAG